MTKSLVCFVVRFAATGKKTGRFGPLCADIEIRRRTARVAIAPQASSVTYLIATKPSRSAKKKRLKAKRHRGRIKAGRGKPGLED